MNRFAKIAILVIYLLLALGFSLINPLFESPDEHWHYFTAQYIADNGRLPSTTQPSYGRFGDWIGQEAAQPPLYYILGSILISPIDTTFTPNDLWYNPQITIGNANALTNQNYFIHTPAEAFPWQDFVLAAHLLRALSILFGLGTLLAVYGSGRILWPNQPEIALLAMALVAFLPQFAFLNSSITNDSLITFLSAAALWQLIRLWQTHITTGRLILLGSTVGLAILSKNAGTLLFIYTIGFIFLLWLKTQSPNLVTNGHKSHGLRSLISNLLAVILPALLLAGWLWWRNWQLYGDPTAANQFVHAAGGARDATIWQVLRETGGLWKSLIATFGWFNIVPPRWLYAIWNGFVITAVIGALWEIKRKLSPSPSEGEGATSLPLSGGGSGWGLVQALHQPWFLALLLAGWVLLVYAGLLYFMLQTEAAQGRLMFPALLPLALALAWGLSRIHWRGIYILVPALALFTAVYTLFFVVAPTYAKPATLTQLPANVTPLSIPMSSELELVGVQMETDTATAQDIIWLTLYWQATTTPTQAPEFVAELLGQENESVSKQQGYHGRGNWPAVFWSPDEIVADKFAMRINQNVDTPTLAQLYVSLVNEADFVNVGAVKIAPATWPEASESVLAQLGDGIQLTAVSATPTTVQPGDTIQVDITWQTTQPQTSDWTTLLHLGDPSQPPLATGDNQPRNGRYPTSVWGAGEVITDSYTLTIPSDLANGRYPLWLGMYNAADPAFTRLSLTIDGTRQPNDTYLITTIEVQQ